MKTEAIAVAGFLAGSCGHPWDLLLNHCRRNTAATSAATSDGSELPYWRLGNGTDAPWSRCPTQRHPDAERSTTRRYGGVDAQS